MLAPVNTIRNFNIEGCEEGSSVLGNRISIETGMTESVQFTVLGEGLKIFNFILNEK